MKKSPRPPEGLHHGWREYDEASTIAIFMEPRQTATTPTSPPLARWFGPPRSDDRRDRGYSSESRTGAASAALGTGPPGAPLGVHGLNVRDPDIEEAANPVGVAWRL